MSAERSRLPSIADGQPRWLTWRRRQQVLKVDTVVAALGFLGNLGPLTAWGPGNNAAVVMDPELSLFPGHSTKAP